MITERQLEIYNNLLKYTQEDETFFTADQVFKGVTYRVFSYRLGSYTAFIAPDALEGRGIMFELDSNDQPVRLACRPIHKFFNLNENPSTMNLDLSVDNIKLIMDKADGSLISTYLDHEGELQLKSKTSLGSDQVQMAWRALKDEPQFREDLIEVTNLGWTVNLEYTGPDNRIVIGYEKPSLRVLNVRNIETGEYNNVCYRNEPGHSMFYGHVVDTHKESFDLVAMEDQQGFEGVVVVLHSGQWFKLKTKWYAALHHTKDSINSKRRLFECVITEAADDLKAMFFDDPVAMGMIKAMEDLVIPKFHAVIHAVDKFYTENKDLDRKSYAIKGQQELQRDLFSLAMSKYLGKEVNYKEWAIKHIEHFGVKDEVKAVEE
jgi:T4 RnlA family RNA ligase